MTTTKPYKCRTHNGIFRIEVRRGRPPVNCTDTNPCDAVSTKRKLAKATGLKESQIVIANAKARVRAVAEEVPTKPKVRDSKDFHEMSLPELKAHARKHFSTISKLTTRRQLISAMEKALAKRQAQATEEVAQEAATLRTALRPTVDSEPRSPQNRSVLVAQAARAELEAVGWESKGRGWADGEDVCAELTATRGSETIVLTWRNGSLTGQDYSIWHSKPSRNAMPKRRLKFNPDEMTDKELIRAIAGMKVTWWNSLAKSEESFTVGTRTLSVEHTFAANGDEDSARRVVKFVDMNGGGFRHFHVDALLKVG